METKDNKIYNCIYASFYHLELMILPIIIKNVEEDSRNIEIITQYNLKNTIQDILERVNLNDTRIEHLNKINWNNNKHKEKESQTIFLIGNEKFIEKWNSKLSGKKIYNCHYFEDVNQINHFENNIINTTSIY